MCCRCFYVCIRPFTLQQSHSERVLALQVVRPIVGHAVKCATDARMFWQLLRSGGMPDTAENIFATESGLLPACELLSIMCISTLIPMLLRACRILK